MKTNKLCSPLMRYNFITLLNKIEIQSQVLFKIFPSRIDELTNYLFQLPHDYKQSRSSTK